MKHREEDRVPVTIEAQKIFVEKKNANVGEVP